MTKHEVPLRQLLLYSAPGFALALLIPPFPAMMAAFYAKYTAATTAGIATALLAARLIDAVAVPLIGYLSDRTRSSLGPRKPWMIGGALVGIAAFWVFFRPPPSAGELYFFAGACLYYVTFALLDIPQRAWAAELTPDYDQRSRIAAFLTVSVLAGGVAFMFLPELLALPAIGVVATPALDNRMMGILGLAGMVLLPATVLLAVLGVPRGAVAAAPSSSLREMFDTVRHNQPFWLYVGADALTQIGYGCFYAVLFVALDSHFGLGERIPIILVTVVGVQLLAVPLCVRVAKSLGKHRTWAWAWLIHAMLAPLGFLFQPGEFDFKVFLLYASVLTVLQAPQMVFPMAIVADIVDYDTLKSGQNRAGSYFSIRTLCNMSVSALGSALGFYVLALVGYDPKTAANAPDAVAGMLVNLLVLPGVFFVLAALLLFRFPIDARRHAIIRRRIDSRAARVARDLQGAIGT
jgi:glycoside/pentoside/hexuronide:cation symporter, GPH family